LRVRYGTVQSRKASFNEHKRKSKGSVPFARAIRYNNFIDISAHEAFFLKT